jgi:hypothetical protein
MLIPLETFSCFLRGDAKAEIARPIFFFLSNWLMDSKMHLGFNRE